MVTAPGKTHTAWQRQRQRQRQRHGVGQRQRQRRGVRFVSSLEKICESFFLRDEFQKKIFYEILWILWIDDFLLWIDEKILKFLKF